jgi:hypothetical protein
VDTRRQINTADESLAFVPCVARDGRPKPKDDCAKTVAEKGETGSRCRLTRGSSAETVADHQSKIVGGALDRVPLLHVRIAPQPRPAQGADLKNVGKAALDLLAAQLEPGAGDAALQPGPIVVDRAAGGGIGVPTGEALLLLLGYARRPRAVLQGLQAGPGVIARVGDQLGRSLRRRGRANQIEHRLGVRQRLGKGLSVPAIGRMDLGRKDGKE